MAIETNTPATQEQAPNGAIKVIERPEEVEGETPQVTSTGVNRRRFLAGLIGAGTGVAIEAHPNTRAIVNPWFEKFFSLVGLREPIVPNIFNNNEQSGVIGEGNSIKVPFSHIQRETRIDPGKAIHIGDFFETQVPANIKYIRGLPHNGEDEAIYNKYKSEGLRNTLAFTDIPEGTIIRSPLPGKVSMPDTKFSDTYLGMNLIFTDEKGETYNFLFTGAKDVKLIAPVPKLHVNSRFSSFNQWVDVEIGTPLFAIQSNELVGSPSLKGFPYPSQLRVEATYGPNGFGKDPWTPIDIFFITQGDKIATPLNYNK